MVPFATIIPCPSFRRRCETDNSSGRLRRPERADGRDVSYPVVVRLLMLLQALTLPPIELPYQPGVPTPPGYHLVESAREDIVVSGAALFGLTYLPVTAFAGTLDLLGTVLPDQHVEGIRFLYIPVAGPFLMASRHFEQGNALRITLLSVLGVAQAAGIVVMAVGLSLRDRSWVRDDLPAVALVPTLTEGGTPGLTLLGRL